MTVLTSYLQKMSVSEIEAAAVLLMHNEFFEGGHLETYQIQIRKKINSSCKSQREAF